MEKEDWILEDQAHKMWAEGRQKKKPTQNEIIEVLFAEGYLAANIDIWMDDMMGLWSWHCNLKYTP